MKVMKFGGTSVGSIESILQVKKIVCAEKDPVIVVVSALGGITDQLIQTAQMAVKGDVEYRAAAVAIRKRHIRVIEGLVDDLLRCEALKQKAEVLLDELEDILKGIFLIQDISQKTADLIVGYGERLSSLIISNVIPNAQWMDARSFIKTEHRGITHVVDTQLTSQLIQQAFAQLPQVSVVPGFIATDNTSGELTNLGRGGSDYTAALLAAELTADVVEIWTDVDGFMTADPRVISSAYVIDELSYAEATELCNFGAKVVYPPTIYPVYHKKIPIRVKNTFHPEAPGTLIVDKVKPTNKVIKGISSINDTCLITIEGLGMVGVVGVNFRIFKALTKWNVNVFMVSQASSENSISIGVCNAQADLACDVLKKEFVKEYKEGQISAIRAKKELSTVAIVGENMKHTPGTAGKLFGTLGKNGINVIACAQGASETNLSFVVNRNSLRKSLNVIHDSFFLSEYKDLNLIICGVGTVGGRLIDQIKAQQQQLKKERGLRLNVVGIASSKRLLLNRGGIDLATYREQLEQAPESSPEILTQEVLKMDIFNSVFVDCTASEEIAAIYLELLSHNVSVVAANKIAASASYKSYTALKQMARQKGVKFLFEANVGAGLPIIHTINDLCTSGDKVLKIEAVLSGTLNYIFNVLSTEIPFSKAILMAHENNYSEPDPRIDLSGKDVVRKLVILVREAGYILEQEDVKQDAFMPASYFEGSKADFWKDLPLLDATFEEQRKQMTAANKRWRFVAKWEDGVASVGLRQITEQHPFYRLEGSNNNLLLTTKRYKEFPMMIQGYGAGAAVTAAGVFADIMSIANI